MHRTGAGRGSLFAERRQRRRVLGHHRPEQERGVIPQTAQRNDRDKRFATMSFGIDGSLICEQDNMVTLEEIGMPKVAAGITTSVDGYITGPNDGPERGVGEGGERLHYWVFGGPWRYAEPGRGEASGADKQHRN